MSNLVLDHIFCFCEDAANSEVARAMHAGFFVSPGKRHHGQGTANRTILFEENYLELIFVDSLSDATSNPIRLDRRANWRASGASPFGICLRGSIEETTQFWEYKPPYWPDGRILIHESNERRPESPLLFVIPTAVRPIERKELDPLQLAHKTGSKRIVEVLITGPRCVWPAIPEVQGIRFSESDRHSVRIAVDGGLLKDAVLNDFTTISGSKGF